MTTTREAALEAALQAAQAHIRSGSDHDYPLLDDIDAALSTPATEPQGYVEGYCKGIDDAVRRYDVMSGPDTWDCYFMAKKSMLALKDFAARPAPQPAADTRVVDRHDLVEWANVMADNGQNVIANDIRAIIGTATPAPSDKIAEAAQVLLGALGDYECNRSHPVFEAAMIGQRDSNKPAPFNQIGDGLIAALRAIAAQGETP